MAQGLCSAPHNDLDILHKCGVIARMHPRCNSCETMMG